MQKKLTITIEALQKFAGCNRQALLAPPTHNPLTTRKRSVIPTNTQFLAAFRATKGVARQNQKDPLLMSKFTRRYIRLWGLAGLVSSMCPGKMYQVRHSRSGVIPTYCYSPGEPMGRLPRPA
jgi:hypothetical protein